MVNALRIYTVPTNASGLSVGAGGKPEAASNTAQTPGVELNNTRGQSTIIIVDGNNNGNITVDNGKPGRVGGDPYDCPDPKGGDCEKPGQAPGGKSLSDRDIIKVLLAILMQLVKNQKGNKAGEAPGGCPGCPNDGNGIKTLGAGTPINGNPGESLPEFAQPTLSTVM